MQKIILSLPKWNHVFFQMRCWLHYLFLIFTTPSTVSLWSCWCVLIYFFMLPQIGMDWTAYALPGRCHPGTTHIFDTSIGIFHPKWSHWKHFSEYATLLQLYNLPPKTTFHCTVLGTLLVVSNVPPASVHPIIIHGNRVILVHIHLYQVQFSLCWPSRCLID